MLQPGAARVGGVNEDVAILVSAAECDVPVGPYAGGAGLREMVRRLSMLGNAVGGHVASLSFP